MKRALGSFCLTLDLTAILKSLNLNHVCPKQFILSHSYPCFQCNIVVTNIFILH